MKNINFFKIRDLRDCKLNNFKLLEPTFRTLGVKFDPQTVNKITQGKMQIAERILYQLKMVFFHIKKYLFKNKGFRKSQQSRRLINLFKKWKI